MKKTNKRIGILIFTLLLVICVGSVIAIQKYPDLNPTHWCYEKIMQFVDKGYIEGYEDKTMRPDRTITRAEYVKVVNNFFGFTGKETTKEFKDISDDAWYASHVYTAVANGYIEGFEDNTFRPEKPITRQEATVILSRILGIDDEEYPKDHKDGLAQYPDGNEVEDWAYTPIHSYSVYNFINGYEDGTLRILQDVTRAETVELLHLLEQKIEIDDNNGKDKEPEKGDNSGGGTTLTVKTPVINAWQIKRGVGNVKVTKTASGWYNYSHSTNSGDIDGVILNITSLTEGATIHENLNTRSGDRSYKTTKAENLSNGIFLPDGVYIIKAYATKLFCNNSSTTQEKIMIDTIAPEVSGVYKETTTSADEKRQRAIYVTILDPKLERVNEISGLNEAKLRYAWFKESGDSFVRFADWKKLSGDEELVMAPTRIGTYKLGVSAYDIAENSYGKLEDIVTTPSGDEKIPFDFVEKVNTDEDIVVIVGEIEGSLNSNIKGATEPGLEIDYNLKITNKEKNEENVKVSFNRPVVVTIGKNEYELESGEFSSEKIKLPGNGFVTIKVSTKVPNDFPVGSGDFDLVATIGILSGDNEIIETKKCDTTDDVEKTVTVAMRAAKDKNVVVVIDTSGSMLFCTEHTHYESSADEFLVYRFSKDYEIPAAFPSIPSKVSGDYLYTSYPLLGHEYEEEGTWKTCKVNETRIEVTEDALYDFVEILANAAKVNNEKISFTITTFSGDAYTGKTFILNGDNSSLSAVNTEISNRTNLTKDGGTNMSAGVDSGVAAFSSSDMLANADNYFIFFGDGRPTSGNTLPSDFTKVTNAKAYAIGFGDAFKDKESDPYKILEAIADNVTHAENAQAVINAFNQIAKTIAEEQQSEEGKIKVSLPQSGTYFPVYFTYVSGDNEIVELYKAEKLEDITNLEDVTIEGNKLIWDISGNYYSPLKGLKVQLTTEDDDD